MSAYQCSPDHIGQLAALLTHGLRGRGHEPILRYDVDPQWGPTHGAADAYSYAFRVLWDENARSVAARYPGDGPATPAPDAPARWHSVDPVAMAIAVPDFYVRVIKAVQCYSYQSCEHDGWATSTASKWMDALTAEAIRSLRGYSAAPWGAPLEGADLASVPTRL